MFGETEVGGVRKHSSVFAAAKLKGNVCALLAASAVLPSICVWTGGSSVSPSQMLVERKFCLKVLKLMHYFHWYSAVQLSCFPHLR